MRYQVRTKKYLNDLRKAVRRAEKKIEEARKGWLSILRFWRSETNEYWVEQRILKRRRTK